MSILKELIATTFQNRMIHIILFWSLSFVVLHQLFTIDYNNGWADIIFTVLFHIPLITVTIINVILVKRFFIKGSYLVYFGFVLGLFLLGILLFRFTFGPITDALSPTYFITLFHSAFEISQFLLSYLIITLLLTVLSNWFTVRNEQLLLEKANNEANLNLLKAQLHPHFLFNSLNNIYSLAQSNPTVSGYILKLSDSLRYMTYETQDELTLLSDELNYLNNYIELEKLRLNNDQSVSHSFTGDPDGLLIAPLMFLPFIENCFKHCDRRYPQIDISLHIDEEMVTLSTSNNLDHEKSAIIGGVGLQNIKQRMKILYPNKHQLNYNIHNDRFILTCTINLSPIN